MEMRIEDKSHSSEDRTLKGLTRNMAALLCYAAGWVSGIIFLVLEQKNRYIRFHALQSIIVFGALALACIVFGHLPMVGPGLSWIIGISGFILWIILMVKALNGETFKLPWAGNLAEILANESIGQPVTQPVKKENADDFQAVTVDRPVAAPARPTKGDIFRAKYYSLGARSGRIVASAFAIAWSFALLVFFNFYNQYIAYYESFQSGGTTYWQAHTLVTSDFSKWLPILTVTLVLSIIGHAIQIVFDKYILRQIVRIVLDVLGAVTVITLLSLFPFDFSALLDAVAAGGVTTGLTIGLIFIAIGFSVGALVRFIRLIVNATEGKY